MFRTAPHPFTADTQAYRNLLYLRHASRQPADEGTGETARTTAIDSVVKSGRVAATLSNDNARRATRRAGLQERRQQFQLIQAEANRHARRGSSSIPARNAAARAAARG